MNELLMRLLRLEGVTLSDPSVSFGFERPLPAWAWAGVVIAAVGLAGWSYWRLHGPAWARAALSAVRVSILLLLVMLLLGPRLVRREDLSENDWVLVLADRSASMSVRDAPGNAGPSSRDEQLRAALERSSSMWERLAKDRTLVWLGFDSGAYDLPAPAKAGSVPELGEASGRRTAVGAALEQALARAAARPVAGIVVLSDGRSVDEPSRQTMRRLESERIAVVGVPLGSPDAVGDFAVRSVDAPRSAFISDVTPVRVEVDRAGDPAMPSEATVRLIDRDTGRVLDEKRVAFKPGDAGPGRVALSGRGDAEGSARWAVEVQSVGSTDLIAENNRADVNVAMIDRPLRVLYVDGYPRWEQRYLKNLLVREKSISCSTLILSPDKKFIQEGDVELEALPDSSERWAEFDAVILGDVSPEVFTRDQLAQLKEHVARRGGGLIWVAGPSFTPLAWFDTALADLLPFSKEAVDGTTLAAPALMVPTPASDRLGLLRLSAAEEENPWPAALASFDAGWSQLQWVQRIDPARLKPAAEVLATARTGAGPSAGEPAPILLAMKYGAGRVIYNATDELWRWRYARGETLYERYWTPMIRLLGRDSLSRSGRSILVEASPAAAIIEQPVRVSVQLLDQSLVELGLGSVNVRLSRGGDPAAATDLVLRPEGGPGPDGAPGGGGGGFGGGASRTYATIWVPSEAGDFELEVTDSALAGRVDPAQLKSGVRVTLPDAELRNPQSNHGLLAKLAEKTGGAIVQPAALANLPDQLPNRKVRVVNETSQPLWDTPLALLLSVLLLSLEWVGRRVIRLV